MADAFSLEFQRNSQQNALERFHAEKALPAAGSRRSLRRHKHSVFALFNAGASAS